MKVSLLMVFFLFSCSVKQDFENDIRVPKILKEYAQSQEEDSIQISTNKGKK